MSTAAQAQTFQAFPSLAATLSTTLVQIKGIRGTLQWLSCGNGYTGTVFVQALRRGARDIDYTRDHGAKRFICHPRRRGKRSRSA